MSESNSHHSQQQSPDHNHLSSNHPHLQSLISTPINATLSLTPNCTRLPYSTNLFIIYRFLLITLCYSSESSMLLPLLLLSSHYPAMKQTLSIMLDIPRTGFSIFTHLPLLSTFIHLPLFNKPACYSLTCLCLAPL